MKICCFFGHRNAKETPDLYNKVRETILHLLQENNATVFLFGGASKFDDLCLKVVTELKTNYPQIHRVYVRAQSSHINNEYKQNLLQYYDDTLLPSGIDSAGKAAYVERNQAVINASDFCIFYYNKDYQPPQTKKRNPTTNLSATSGTKLAYEYAKKQNKEILNLY